MVLLLRNGGGRSPFLRAAQEREVGMAPPARRTIVLLVTALMVATLAAAVPASARTYYGSPAPTQQPVPQQPVQRQAVQQPAAGAQPGRGVVAMSATEVAKGRSS